MADFIFVQRFAHGTHILSAFHTTKNADIQWLQNVTNEGWKLHNGLVCLHRCFQQRNTNTRKVTVINEQEHGQRDIETSIHRQQPVWPFSYIPGSRLKRSGDQNLARSPERISVPFCGEEYWVFLHAFYTSTLSL
jgi:hypothetical protein